MLTKEQAKLKAKALSAEGRIIEAGFTMHMLKAAPDSTPETVTRMVRYAFFTGVKHVLDVMAAAQASDMSDAAIERVVGNLQTELNNYQRWLQQQANHKKH